MEKISRLSLAMLAASASLLPFAAQAQELSPLQSKVVGNSVSAQSAVPDAPTTPMDFKVGGGVNANLTYDDNVYNNRSGVSDWAAVFSPYLSAKGDLGSTTLSLRAYLDQYEYFKESSENRTDYGIGAKAVIHSGDAADVYLSGGYSQAHEDRGDPAASQNDAKPTLYNNAEAAIGFAKTGEGVNVALAAAIHHFDFKDQIQRSGVSLNNDDRDRDNYGISGQVGFGLSSGANLFVRGGYSWTNYSSALDDFGFNKDSQGYQIEGGLGFGLTKSLKGEVRGGYLHHSYDDTRFGEINSWSFGGNLAWAAGDGTSLNFDLGRSVQETQDSRYRGYINTSATVSVSHSFDSAFSASAGIGYGHDDYRKSLAASPSRSDDSYSANVGLAWVPVHNLNVGLNYSYSDRDSSLAGPGDHFASNTVSLSLGVHF